MIRWAYKKATFIFLFYSIFVACSAHAEETPTIAETALIVSGGLVGEVLGAAGAGYLTYAAFGRPHLDAITPAYLVIAPATVLGGVYGATTGVYLTGRAVGENGQYQKTAEGAWLGLLATALIATSESATVNQNSEAYVGLMVANSFLVPAVTTLFFNGSLSGKRPIRVAPVFISPTFETASISHRSVIGGALSITLP